MGTRGLSEAEHRQFQAAYDAGDAQAFCRLFGPDKIVENLGEFLGYFMPRKVVAGEDLLRASGTVTGKLIAWLAARGLVASADGHQPLQRARAAARELPRAARAAALLYDAVEAARPIDVQALADEDYLEDELIISRVEAGRLWFGEGLGPVQVPRAATELVQPGWSISLALGRVRGRWRILQVGNVYPG